MLKSKTKYADHQTDISMHNPKTHTARQYNIHDFDKGIGNRCPIDIIEYYNHNNKKKNIQCYFQSRLNKTKSKVYWN